MKSIRREKSEYEHDIAAIRGKRLQNVRYFELQYGSDRPFYREELFQGHVLDFGCDLEMTDGSIFGIIWDDEFTQFGIGVYRQSLSDQLNDPRVWLVTSEPHWAGLIGQVIENVSVYWSWEQYAGHERQAYPQDIALEFDNGSRVFFSAAQFNSKSGQLWGTSDDIVVIFDEDSAKRYGVGPYANEIAAR